MGSSTRREFLESTGRHAAACAASLLLGRELQAAPPGSVTTLPALPPRARTTWIDPAAKSVVADLRAQEVVADTVIHETLLREMIDEGVRLATHTDTAEAGWNKLIAPGEIVGVKFNEIGRETIGTTEPFAIQLVESLKRAGIAPDRLMLIEVPERLVRRLKTKPAPIGFAGEKVSFGSGEDELAAVLQEVGAFVNVPFLKTHNIAQMTCCLKNLSHALVRRPRLCHANQCSPFVGDILSLPQIRPKLRVHIVNALRCLFDGGPLPERDALWRHCGILVSTDPVAADHVGIDIINAERARRGLPPIGDREAHVPHVRSAALRGLGTDDQDYITIERPDLF